jgi:hypothetical protein
MPSTRPSDPSARLRLALERAGIRNPSGDPASILDKLPASDPPAHPEASICEPLVFPLPVAPSRIAIIGGRFSEAKNVRDFDVADIEGLAEWKPEALVAPLEDALALAWQTSFYLSSAIVVLTSVGSTPLDDSGRDSLWKAFGVPIFEQLRSWRGDVIARECEAHAGMHIVADSAILQRNADGEILLTMLDSKRPILKSRTGLMGEIVGCECECGSGIPRLRNLASVTDLAIEAEATAGD